MGILALHISGDTAATLSYFRISNVSVHDVGGVATTKQSGLIDISPPAPGAATVVDDVVIDGATVFNHRAVEGYPRRLRERSLSRP